MADTRSELLPVLSLDDVVVFPHVTVTVTVAADCDAQKAAIRAAQERGHMIFLVPHVDGRDATIGTVCRIRETGQLPNGIDVAILSGDHRARVERVALEKAAAI